MLAARYDEFGPVSVLNVVEADVPKPGPGQVRVRVKAAGLNPIDSKQRRGLLQQNLDLPSGIGRELAGIVDDAGEGVTQWKSGDEVFGCVDGDAIAEYALADAASLASKPEGVSWVAAGGLALVGQTAYSSVTSQDPKKTDTVLVSAAAGGVGAIAAQLVKRTGATVIGTASAEKHTFLKQLGIIPIAYGAGLVDRIRNVAPNGVTMALDNHGAETVEAAIALGVDKDRINSIAHTTGYGVKLVGRGPANTTALRELAALVKSGELVIPLEAAYPLTEVSAAYEHLEQGHARGKIVIIF